MTEQHHHGAHQGGHELDAPPTRELFNIVWGLSALTLLSLITCVQLFHDQTRDLAVQRGKEGSPLLASYRQEMHERTTKGGTDELTDATGKVVARYAYIPLASARDLILAKPEKLGAFPPPPGWIHPDDVAAGGQGSAPPPGAADPNQPDAAAGDQPAGTPPAGDAPAGTPPAGDAPAGTPPAGDAPAGTPSDAQAPADAPAAPANAKPEGAADAAPPPPTAPAPNQ